MNQQQEELLPTAKERKLHGNVDTPSIQRSSMLGNGEEQYTEHFNNLSISSKSPVRARFENVLTFYIVHKN